MMGNSIPYPAYVIQTIYLNHPMEPPSKRPRPDDDAPVEETADDPESDYGDVDASPDSLDGRNADLYLDTVRVS